MDEDRIYLFSTGPGCHKCSLTKNRFNKMGLPFEEIRIDQDEEWRRALQNAGYQSAPVVLIPNEDVWEDFRSEDIAYVGRMF